MADNRFKVMAVSTFKESAVDCPVQLKKYQIIYDVVADKTYLRVIFESFSNKKIIGVFLNIDCADVFEQKFADVEKAAVNVECDKKYSEFGKECPIIIPKGTKTVKAYISRVVFSDMTVWENRDLTFVAPVSDLKPYTAFKEKKQLEKELAKRNYVAKYLPVRYEKSWRCTCGHLNGNLNDVCSACMSRASILFNIFDDKNLEIRRKEDTYDEARKFDTSKDYLQASKLYSTILDYKDSKVLFAKALENSKEAIYTSALDTLKTAQKEEDFDSAIKNFSSISEYKDAKTQTEKAKEQKKEFIYNQTLQRVKKEHARKKKKVRNISIVACVITAIVIAILIPYFVEPNLYTQETTYERITIGDQSGYCLERYNENEDKVVIPSEYLGKPVLKIGEDAFRDKSIKEITIPSSVTSIDREAFYNCTSLTDVYYKGDIAGWCGISFENVYANPMYYAYNLYIDGKLVEGELIIPDSVTTIGDYAFYNCDLLTSVTIGDSVTSIGDSAFYNTAWYNNQPDGLIYVGKVAYEYKGTMPSNTSIIIKDGTISITGAAFYHCSGLTSITIPNSVTSIGSSAFEDCSSLTDVYYTGDIAGWCGISFGSPMYYADNLYIDGKLVEGELVISDRVTTIGNFAFWGCTRLTSITIPASVTSIGSGAFSNCYSLTSIVIPDSVTSIGSGAFSNCHSLTSITIPDSVTAIGDQAFWGCTRLTSVTIGDSVTTIGDLAFYNCYSLTSITIPDSVTTIGYAAFEYCTSLTDVYYTGTKKQWKAISKGSYWNNNVPATQVICKDGTVSI